MNKKNIEQLKKGGILLGICIAVILILWGTYYLGGLLKEEVYITAAEKVFADSPLCTEFKNIKIIRNTKKNITTPHFCNAFLYAENNGEAVYVLFINMTGKYGSYQGVFIYPYNFTDKDASDIAVKFCGLTGNINLHKTADYYGITPLIISTAQKKIQKKLMERKPENGKK